MSLSWHEIHDHLKQSSSNLSFQRSFDAIQHNISAVVQFRDPAAVLDALHRPSGEADQKNLILRTLVHVAQSNRAMADCALTLLLLALWPGLDAIRRRSIWRKLGPPEEVASDILARTTEAIRGLDHQRVNWIAATVLRNIERDMIRAHQREAERQRSASDMNPDDFAAEHVVRDPTLTHSQLQNDVHRLIGSDATLVIRVAIEGFSQAEVAIELGLSESATRKRYQRATRRLRDALQKKHDLMS